jgi:Peptidase M50B-like
VLRSRQLRMLTAHFPDVTAAVGGFDVDVVLDGELVIWRAGRLDFGALQDRLRSGPARARAPLCSWTDNAFADRVETLLVTTEVAASLTWPVLSGAAVGVLVLLLAAGDVVGRVVTITHEGGHMVVGFLTGGNIKHFYLNADRPGGATAYNRLPGWLGILTTFAGYSTPPLVGLGGAALLKEGKAWPLLWTAVGLLVLAWVKARDELTSVVVLLVAGFIGYVGLYGAPVLQAAFAAGLVVLLLGGLRAAAMVPTDKASKSDAVYLARSTWIPASLWKAGFIVVALLCAWKGFQVLVK